jgi:hypothetical protein
MNKVTRLISSPDRMDWYVNIYKVDRAYGGPEEGGWYYDVGELVESKCFSWAGSDYHEGTSYDNAIDYSEQVEKELMQSEKLPYNMGYGPHDGCDNDGNGDDNYLIPGGNWGEGSYKIEVSPKKGANYPTERPYWD